MLEPVTLEPALREKLQRLADAWSVEVPSHADGCEGDSSVRERVPLVPPARTRSKYDAATQNKLEWKPPRFDCSPWDERFQPRWKFMEQEKREELLQWEARHREATFADRLRGREELPIWAVRDELISSVRANQVTLVLAETGSGKSTQVPQFLLDSAIERGEGESCHIICTQPRRLAAVSLATRVAWERGEDGYNAERKSVGHVVRWDEKPPEPWASIVFCTVGALLPRIWRLGASVIVIDEAHTRDVHTDLLLAVLRVLLASYANLRVVVMSATFDASKFLDYFGGAERCGVVRASGRPYHVQEWFLEDIIQELNWRPHAAALSDAASEEQLRELPQGVWEEESCTRIFNGEEGAYSPATIRTVNALDESLIPLHLVLDILRWIGNWNRVGAVLLFLPGWQEIAVCHRMMMRDNDPVFRKMDVVRLHSSVPQAEQNKAFWPAPPGRRKVLLSTDIAETSVTIPDVICVIDCAVAKVKQGNSLVLCWASQANLKQRKGRAGRVQDGACIHLVTRRRFERLPREPTPEMLRVPLEEVVLSICDLGLDQDTTVAAAGPAKQESSGWWQDQPNAWDGIWRFLQRAPDPPLEKTAWAALCDLQHVGALDDQGYVTHLGAFLGRLPLPPRIGAALFLGGLLGAPHSASAVAAAVETRAPWTRRKNGGGGGDADEESGAPEHFARSRTGAGDPMFSDAFAVARALQEYESAGKKCVQFCTANGLNAPVMEQMAMASWQLCRFLADAGCVPRAGRGSEAAGSSADATAGPQAGVAAGSAAEGAAASCEDQDVLEDCWPLMQAMLVFAGDRHLGELLGGRRVSAGWRRSARLPKTSVLYGTFKTDPPSSLLTYADFASGSAGRLLMTATMVTPQQLLLFGGAGDGPTWKDGHAEVDGWLQIRSGLADAALLGSLRTVTRKVLQYAGQVTMEHHADKDRNEKICGLANDPWVDEWRECVRAVAALPLPALDWNSARWDTSSSRLPTHPAVASSSSTAGAQPMANAEAAPGAFIAGAAASVPSPEPLSLALWSPAVAQSAGSEPSPVSTAVALPEEWKSLTSPSPAAAEALSLALRPQAAGSEPTAIEELPCGWLGHWDARSQRWYYSCRDPARPVRWKLPAPAGADGTAFDWRWLWRKADPWSAEVRWYVQVTGERRRQPFPPEIGDGLVLPWGYEAIWDASRLSHYYWDLEQDLTSWRFPFEMRRNG